MPIKKFAHTSQRHLSSLLKIPVGRAHVYELIAAAYGYRTATSLWSQAVFTFSDISPSIPINSVFLGERAVELGYAIYTANEISNSLSTALLAEKLRAIKICDLISVLRDESWEIESDGALLAGLESAAARGNADAHYAIALLNDPEVDETQSSEHWYLSAMQGAVLTGAPKEWADNYAEKLVRDEKYSFHLKEAARLGNPLAKLDAADRFDDTTFFDDNLYPADVDPVQAADLAIRLGRPKNAHSWLTISAEQGHIESMRELIEAYDTSDLLKCWTWIYLAKRYGIDLTQDDYQAIHEDGSDYDDDQGGAMFADGTDGINLDKITAKQDALAQEKAHELFIQNRENDSLDGGW